MKKHVVLIAGIILGSLLILIISLQLISIKDVTVRMTDQGFNPNKIEIQPGQKVVWINEGKKERWPASNNHPTHTNYPTKGKGCLGSLLDACKNLKTGEVYVFEFDKPGSWGIHDHLNPGSIMVVEVMQVSKGWLGKIQILANKLSKDKNNIDVPTPEDFRKLSYGEQAAILDTYAKNSPEGAWSLIKSAFIIDGQVITNAHEFSHIVGNTSYRKYGIGGVAVCDTSFAYGCYHGVAEAAINDKGEKAVSEIEKACSDYLNPYQVTSCYHGIGHGTAGIHDLKLSPALSACNLMKQENRGYCYDGVFMEHANSSAGNGIDREKPWTLCEELDVAYHKACGRYQPVRLQGVGLNIEQIIRSCSPASSNILEEHCFRSSGFASTGEGRNSVETINKLCREAKIVKGSAWCLIGGANEMAFQAYQDWQTSATALCAFINIDELQLECTSTVKTVADNEGHQ